jgi:hypothetical protein
MSARPAPPRQLWWLVAGFAVWSSALVALYAFHGLGCAFAWPAGPLRMGLALVLLAHLAAIGWMWRHLVAASSDADTDATGGFLRVVAAWTVIAAFAATILTLGPPLLLTGCK